MTPELQKAYAKYLAELDRRLACDGEALLVGGRFVDSSRLKAAQARSNAVLEKAMGKQSFDGRYEWMGDHPEDIGGHDPDVHQVALCLGPMIREAYPINEVPAEVVRLLRDCESSCRIAEERVKLLIEMVSTDLKPDTAGRQYHRLPGSETERQRTEAKLTAKGPLPLCPACGEKVTGVTHDDDLPERGSGEGITRYRPCGCPFGPAGRRQAREGASIGCE